MHKLAEKIADCLKAKVEGMGIDNINGQDLVELGMWTDIIKDLVCYDKDKKIIEAMDEAEESEEAMKYIEMYEDYPERKGYRGQPRSKTTGRYMSRNDGRRSNGGRRGYDEQMYYTMTPEMYHMYPAEYYRDMDKEMGRMYYSSTGEASTTGNTGSTGTSSNTGSARGYSENDGGQYSSRMQRDGEDTRGYQDGYSKGYSDGTRSNQRDSREGRSGQSRKGYMQSKEQGKDKQEKMKNLEEYMKELSSDVSEMIEGASPEEKTMMKNKMSVLIQKIS